jgi:uncharacterized membrane protein YbhN (UPF0104 family)
MIVAAITEGALVLLWLYVWLISTICATYLSERKGYGDRPGLASGLILSAIGAIIWLIVPPKPDSKWKTVGPWGRERRKPAATN